MPAESVRHLTAAVAIRPGSALAHDTLGNALRAQGKLKIPLPNFAKPSGSSQTTFWPT